MLDLVSQPFQSTEFEFGVFLVWGNITGGECWSTTGIAPGFTGPQPKPGTSGLSITALGAPPTWQILSLAESCDGTSEGKLDFNS